MSLTIRYENVAGTLSSIGSNVVRLGGLALTQSADLGEMATSELDWDDPDGTWTLTGYRVFTMSESAAPSNNQQVYRGRLNSRTYKRGPSMRTGTGRRITVELMDQNVLLGWRVMKDADANRPAETAGDRIRWLVNTRRAPVFAHPTYFANPTTAMDAADYRNQRYNDVLADIANVSGYNFWADYDEGRQRTELFFIDPESTDYSSTLQISNSLADVDSVITFAPSEDAELIVDPSRVAASVLGVYDGGDVYTTRDSTGNTFAYVDQTYELSNIKSEAKARALNTRYLDDNDEEDKHVTCSIIVPAASVNKVLHGQRILATFTHLANEGLGSATWYRITKRTVIQEEEIGLDYYRIALDLSPQGAAAQGALQTVTLAMFNDIFPSDTVRNASAVSGPLTFTVGQVWRWTITNNQHTSLVYTDALALRWGAAVIGDHVVRAFGVSSRYSGPDLPTIWAGNPPPCPPCASPFPADTGTFTITVASATGVFDFYASTNIISGPQTQDEGWTCVLERLS